MSPVLLTAVGRVVAGVKGTVRDSVEVGDVAALAKLVAGAVHEIQGNPQALIDDRLHSTRARRILDLLRGEVISCLTDGRESLSDIRDILIAMESLRQTMEFHGIRPFAGGLWGTDGLDLLVAIAHDLRSPLTSVLFLAETLQRGQSGPVNDVQHRQLGLIYGAALGLSSVASDVIELARGGSQLMEKEPTPFSVVTVFDSVRDIVRPIAEEKQLAVHLVPPAVDQRMGHPVALSRVLLNLTTNALKFTAVGHVELSSREIGPDRVEFSVRDSGRGIDPAIVSSLYQPLRNGGGRGGQAFSQTGLGLAMCRALVEAMGSELNVETRRGWGTRFYFDVTLPPCPIPGSAPVAAPTSKVRTPRTYRAPVGAQRLLKA
ncbi:MAG TPA: HAMP domain-containing sensor histidine kinase [Gemmatimonadales bacterium]|nr:HAMP domain-containing sensor histidine kinase [Gemmatimonadales bacterium]